MLKCLMILAIAAVAAVGVSAQSTKIASHDKQDLKKKNPSTVVFQNNYYETPSQAQKATPNPPKWYEPLEKPDWWLVGVGIVTFFVVGWQARLMRKHAVELKRLAEIADRQTDYMITSERAWMVANVEKLHVPHSQLSNEMVMFSVRCVNKGKTPAFLMEIGNHGVVHPRDTILPAIQPPYAPENVERWEDKGLPLQPGADIVRHNITITPCPEKIHTGQNELWIYGYINYRDAFGTDRETRYCFLWDNNCSKSIEEDRPSCYLPRGPAPYNYAT